MYDFHTLSGGQQELSVFFLRAGRVRFGLQGSDPHSDMSKPIFNLNSFMAFHSEFSPAICIYASWTHQIREAETFFFNLCYY